LITYSISCRKVLNTRLFDNDEEKPWTKSVVDKNYEILFGTLHEPARAFYYWY